MAGVAREGAEFAGRRTLWVTGAVAVVGWVITVIGFIVEPARTSFAYLAAFAYAVSIALGALGFVMIAHLTRAKWPIMFRRFAEAVAMTLPVLAALFVPVVIGAGFLYSWVGTPAGLTEHELHLLEHKRAYLNLPAFVIRAVVYFATWTVIAVLLARWSARRDRAPDAGGPPRERAASAVGIPAVGLTLTFASFDWLMSLDFTWFSSMFGVYFLAGGFLGCLALLAALGVAAERSGYLAGQLTGAHFHGVGRLILTFVIFWAYTGYFQLMLIWIANRPVEVTFYILRTQGTWEVVSWLLIVLHFAVPFFLLLSREIKYRRRGIATIAGLLLVMHYVDMYWLVLPNIDREGLSPSWVDLPALAAVVGTAALFGAWRLRGRPLVPTRDPAIAAALAYRSKS